MDPNLSVTSIDFGLQYDYKDANLTTVTLNYSDGSSKLFEQPGHTTFVTDHTVTFDADTPVMAVQGSTGRNEVTQIGFFSEGEKIDEYNP